MQYRTYEDLRNEVLKEMDMELEDFIQDSEVMGYFNDAIKDVSAAIQKLGLEDDYFLTHSDPVSLTRGQKVIDMPADIYANKIRGLTYTSPSKVYPIRQIKGPNTFQIIQNIIQNASPGTYYRFKIENKNSTLGPKIGIYPYAYEDTADCIVIDYIRNCERVTTTTSKVEVPEFYSFVKAFVKHKLAIKEGGPLIGDMLTQENKERVLMLETLTEMVPDYDSEIKGDLSIYEEHS